MNNLFPSQKKYLAPSTIENAGRGIFASQDIKKDEVIETCPVIELQEVDVPLLKKTELRNYYFMWGTELEKVAICLGWGSLYNHSYTPNATYKKRMEENLIDFIAIKDIKKDEEITVNYNFGKPDDKTTLWIKEINPAV